MSPANTRRDFLKITSTGLGMVTIHSETKEVTRSGQYWAFAHFSRTIRGGARRIDSKGTPADVFHVAFENPDGEKVLILTNLAAARTVRVEISTMATEVALAADSLTTLTWK